MDRVTMAGVIQRAVAASRTGADEAAARLQVATQPGLLPPAHYRHHVQAAVDVLGAIGRDLDDLLDLLTYYALLYPEAHDDDPAQSGLCACGRPADSCPARAACAAGELEWTAEDGTVHAVNEAARWEPSSGPPDQPADPPPAEQEPAR